MQKSKLPDIGTSIFTVMSALAHEQGAINLAQGFPNFDCDPVLKALVSKFMEGGKNQYAPMAGVKELMSQLASKVNFLYDRKIDPEKEITITAGATQGIFTAIGAMVSPGDEVIVFEPAYDSYIPSILTFGGIPVPVTLSAPDFKVDWLYVESLINNKTRLIIINTPHNPGARVLSKRDLDQLTDLVERYAIYVLSDEVYEHLIYDHLEHHSVIRYPRLYERSFAVYSFGKIFHNTGWKTGYCLAPPALTEEFRKVHQFNVFSVHTPTQYAIAEYLKNPDVYMDLSAFFQEKRDRFISLMKGSAFQFLPSEGSYFILGDYSRISKAYDMEFAQWLTREIKVGVIPISPFYSAPPADQRVVRFCFAKTDDILEEASERLKMI
jgi:methionine aminotransferase